MKRAIEALAKWAFYFAVAVIIIALMSYESLKILALLKYLKQ